MMRGFYLAPSNIPNIDFNEMETKGVTDIFLWSDQYLTDYDTCKLRINQCKTAISETRIKLHLWIAPFKDIHLLSVDPANTTHLNTMGTVITNLINDTEIDGISFDDYLYSVDIYDTNPSNAEYQQNVLANYAQSIKTVIDNTNPNILFSGALTWEDGKRGTNHTLLAPCFDFIIPEIYRYDVPERTSSWIIEQLNSIKTKAGNNRVIPALMTYETDTPPYNIKTTESIIYDVKMALSNNKEGYILFVYNKMPQDITFPRIKNKYLAPNLFVSCIE